jgi:hypothetical protein
MSFECYRNQEKRKSDACRAHESEGPDTDKGSLRSFGHRARSLETIVRAKIRRMLRPRNNQQRLR